MDGQGNDHAIAKRIAFAVARVERTAVGPISLKEGTVHRQDVTS
jgi:hypothetical protein